MPSEEELIAERKAKRSTLVKAGKGYPYRYDRTHTAGQLHSESKDIAPETMLGKKVKVCGRLMALRNLGKIAFAKLADESGSIQLWFKEDALASFGDLKLVDMGDFLGAEGELCTTKTGELTVLVNAFEILSKSIRPLPDKWHGLQDIEQKYRLRYLDMAMSPEVREVFKKRSKILKAVRERLDSEGFIELETPILQPIYGGANARPFVTAHNELKMKMYLKISPELYLKRLLVGGFEKVYEISKCFRNESIDTTHNPEFTMVEIYKAYADYNDMMILCEEIYESAALAANGNTVFEWQGNKVDVKAPWQRLTMKQAIKEIAGIDVDTLDDKGLQELQKKHKLEIHGEVTRGKLIAEIFDKLASSKIIQPTHIIDHPKETTPLCKAHRTEEGLIERFESFICGMEVSNAYSELNDPVIQRQLLEEQSKQLTGGDEEAHPMDEDFLRAIDHGMPPAGGLGMGLDRMIIFLTEQPSIRDIIPFPTMKPFEQAEAKPAKGSKPAKGKK